MRLRLCEDVRCKGLLAEISHLQAVANSLVLNVFLGFDL